MDISVGISIGALLDWVKSFAGKNNRHVGQFRCQWNHDYPPNNPYHGQVITDYVTLKPLPFNRMRGDSVNETYGACYFVGDNSNYAITFSYRGKDDKSDLVGVVVLQKSPGTFNLNGHWWQYTSKNIIAGGTTKWKKVN